MSAGRGTHRFLPGRAAGAGRGAHVLRLHRAPPAAPPRPPAAAWMRPIARSLAALLGASVLSAAAAAVPGSSRLGALPRSPASAPAPAIAASSVLLAPSRPVPAAAAASSLRPAPTSALASLPFPSALPAPPPRAPRTRHVTPPAGLIRRGTESAPQGGHGHRAPGSGLRVPGERKKTCAQPGWPPVPGDARCHTTSFRTPGARGRPLSLSPLLRREGNHPRHVSPTDWASGNPDLRAPEPLERR